MASRTMGFWQSTKQVPPIQTRNEVLGRNVVLTDYEEVGDKKDYTENMPCVKDIKSHRGKETKDKHESIIHLLTTTDIWRGCTRYIRLWLSTVRRGFKTNPTMPRDGGTNR